MMNTIRELRITDAITKEELNHFLGQLERWAETEIESEVFFHRVSDYVADEFILTVEAGETTDFLFAKMKDELVGYVWLGEAVADEFPKDYHVDFGLWDLYLLPPYRGQSIGRALYQKALDTQAQWHEHSSALIAVEPLTPKAESFFKQLGFTMTEDEFFIKSEKLH